MNTQQRMSFLLYLQGLVIADYAEKGHEPGTALGDVDEFVNWYYDAGYKAGHDDDDGYVAGHRDGADALMSPAQELSLLLEQVADVDIDTIWRIIGEHEFVDHSAGDGYTEPREHWIDCIGCKEAVWGWQQYYAETDEDPQQAKKRHLIMVLVDAVLNEGKPDAQHT